MSTGYLIFNDFKSAQDRSHSEALARGCKSGDITQFWWSILEHPKDPTKTILLLDDTRTDFAKDTLTTDEKLQVGIDPTILAPDKAELAEIATNTKGE